MPVGGRDAKPKWVVTLTRGGRAISSTVLNRRGAAFLAFATALIGMCCSELKPPSAPQPPQGPPIVVVDSSPDADAADDSDVDAAELPSCRYREPEARTLKRQPRIVGGHDAKEGAWPFAVSVNAGTFHYCGASVLSDHWILTAAHCIVGIGDKARIGHVDRTSLRARTIPIVKSRLHFAYDAGRFKWDVAVARLLEPAGVQPVTLADEVRETTTEGTEFATVIGWGRLKEGGSTKNWLQEVEVPMVDRALCNLVYGDIDGTQVCADSGRFGSCQGDSGGPLLQLTPAGYQQVGIVSFGRGCARPDAPGVYTNVTHPEVRAWIESCARD